MGCFIFSPLINKTEFHLKRIHFMTFFKQHYQLTVFCYLCESSINRFSLKSNLKDLIFI